MIRVMRPTGVPFLATAANTTVTSSPALNVLALKPKLTSVDGAWFSQTQCATLPFSSVTSSIRNVCGFDQIQLVTLPFMVTSLFSYDALPWCASTGVEPAATTSSSKLARHSLFIHVLLYELESPGSREYTLGRNDRSTRQPRAILSVSAAPAASAWRIWTHQLPYSTGRNRAE